MYGSLFNNTFIQNLKETYCLFTTDQGTATLRRRYYSITVALYANMDERGMFSKTDTLTDHFADRWMASSSLVLQT